MKPNFRPLPDREWGTETRGWQHFVEEVKLEWALGQVAGEGEEGRRTSRRPGRAAGSLQKGRKERGTAVSSDAPALTRGSHPHHEAGTRKRRGRSTSVSGQRLLPAGPKAGLSFITGADKGTGMWVSVWHQGPH